MLFCKNWTSLLLTLSFIEKNNQEKCSLSTYSARTEKIVLVVKNESNFSVLVDHVPSLTLIVYIFFSFVHAFWYFEIGFRFEIGFICRNKTDINQICANVSCKQADRIFWGIAMAVRVLLKRWQYILPWCVIIFKSCPYQNLWSTMACKIIERHTFQLK